MKYRNLIIILGIVLVSFVIAGYYIVSYSFYLNAPDGSNWEVYLRNRDVVSEDSVNIRIEDKREISSGVLSLDVYEELPSGMEKSTMVYVDVNTGDVEPIMSYVVADEEISDKLHE